MYNEKLSKLVEKFAQLVVEGQTKISQPSDIEDILTKAGFYSKNIMDDVAALLPKAGIPNSVAVNLGIVVDEKLNVSFSSLLTPTNANQSAALSGLLRIKYSTTMSKVLRDAGFTVPPGQKFSQGWFIF